MDRPGVSDPIIIFSKRKTLVVEVRPNLSVTVRAPERTSQTELERFLKKSEAWIQKKLHYFQTKPLANPEPRPQREEFAPAMVKQIFETLYEKCWEQCKAWGYPKPRLRIRKMKSRWGSISTKTMIVTLNSEMIHLPTQCIEDVIMHEFCHLKHMNHGKRFHKLLEKMAPGWKSRKWYFSSLHHNI